MESLQQSAINALNQIDGRLRRSFANTPDDRLNWSPAPTARTPLQLIAHCGFSLGFIREMLAGKPYPAPTMAQADAEFIEMERGITTSEAALDLWERNLNAYIAHVQAVPDTDLDSMTRLPFGLPECPLGAILHIGAVHTQDHVAQLEYLQTIYGDRVW